MSNTTALNAYRTLLQAEINLQAPAEQREMLLRFADELLPGMDAEDLRDRDPQELYAILFYAWTDLRQFRQGEPVIQLFAPNFEEHGWRSQHSALLVIAPGMPFLSESLRLELNRRGLTIHRVFSSDIYSQRDDNGAVAAVMPAEACEDHGDLELNTVIYVEFSRVTDQAERLAIRRSLETVVERVSQVVTDYDQMTTQVRALADTLANASGSVAAGDVAEHQAFLHWLLDNNFTLLGYETISVSWSGKVPSVSRSEDALLGLCRTMESSSMTELEQDLNDDAGRQRVQEHQLEFFKSAERVGIHRLAYPDLISINEYDSQGRLRAQHRLLGLYTAVVYTMEPADIPVVRRKVAAVVQRARPSNSSYRVRAVERVMEVLPRDELFECEVDALFETVLRIFHIQERRKIRLFVRLDRRRLFASCLVYWPRDIYQTELRQRIESLLRESLNASESEFTTFFSESVLVRTHFLMRLGEGEAPVFDVADIEQRIVRMAQRWQDRLLSTLVDEFGEEQAARLFDRFGNGFPAGYQDDHQTPQAAADIRQFQRLEQQGGIAVHLYRLVGDSDAILRFRMCMQGQSIDLSTVIPILENLGLRVIGERPYRIVDRLGSCFWVSDFSTRYELADDIDVTAVSQAVETAFTKVFEGAAEDDAFNRLVVGTRMSWREVAVLRAYAKYMRQLRYTESQQFVADTLARHLGLAQALIELFYQRFDPSIVGSLDERNQRQQQIEAHILADLETVQQLNEDLVLRSYLGLILATLRTNYFQPDARGEYPTYFAFKLHCAQVPNMPRPVPEFEIFVYSPRVEGVHLRRGTVARGGLRWSDRREDFRTEVLGLVKAQQVKNAVIVPVGAKGGFVLKQLPANADRETTQAEGIACYRTFIGALLDITDNLAEDKVIPPAHVIRHDGDDPYLVVAADKGTASFSDIANEISAQHGFWLGDAFASGGSVGYDHKKMGITARGAWVSVQRHFREFGVDVQQSPFSVVGIGDMSGDVFGNGMLLSEHIRLVAAFNHQHIFLDPDPDAAQSFNERKRLFALPRSGWSDYSTELISAGGGVYSRAAKSIAISPEVRQLLDIRAEQLTPAELLAAILRAPVDLIWNGGIGTYVKATSEKHQDVGDKANDGLRVDARELRCKVVGEGGNLGMTQLARVEFALNGGACNTDFIDNSAGVDCSDHEVNIKILLNQLVADGELTAKHRAAFLEQMTHQVAELVLHNNYRQTQAISIAQSEALMRHQEYRALIVRLEASAGLDRELECLPSDDELNERILKEQSLSRPELAVLVCYVKIMVKQALLASPVVDEPVMAESLFLAFPTALRERFEPAIRQHKLRREIVATQLTNDMVDLMGITFIERLLQASQVGIPEIVGAYVVAREVLGLHCLWEQVEQLDHLIDPAVQLQLFSDLQRVTRLATRWFIRNRRAGVDVQARIAQFAAPVQALHQSLPHYLQGEQLLAWQQRRDSLKEHHLPESMLDGFAGVGMLLSTLGVIDVAQQTGRTIEDTARMVFSLNDCLGFYWLSRQITSLRVTSYWEAMARESYFDELDWQVRAISTAVGKASASDEAAACERWLDQHPDAVQRWQRMVEQIRSVGNVDYPMFAVMVRALIDLAQAGSQASN